MLRTSLLLLMGDASGMVLGGHRTIHNRPRAMPCMEFGDAFYMGYNYAAQYGPQQGDPILPTEGDTWDPAMPEGWTEVQLQSPLGIMFEENERKIGPAGVVVIDLVPDGNAAKSGLIAKGDQLVGVTGIRVMGGKYERLMCDCRKWDFDTVVDAIGSNTPSFKCDNVILRFERPPAEAAPP
mmetsp:Transcript_23805/g.48367  ORF Transcript_23805/g.48367 Transcript_23805/m.48367 type:complete len:181 (+) Transcript_23805:60-602(+)